MRTPYGEHGKTQKKEWLPRFDAKKALTTTNAYDIVFLGDSITHGWPIMMPGQKKVNELIHPLADGKDVIWFDLKDAFTDSEGLPDIKLLPDGTHPGPEGYTVWADSLLQYLKAL